MGTAAPTGSRGQFPQLEIGEELGSFNLEIDELSPSLPEMGTLPPRFFLMRLVVLG